jgi:hypothetical protein
MVAEIKQIFLKITFNNIKKILGCVYIPLGTSSDVYSNHCNTVESIFFNFPEYNFVITGDFNLNTFDWSVDPNSQNHRSSNILYNTYINLLNLKQSNSIKNCIGRTLDCIMLSDQAELTSIYLSDSLVPSIDKYHPPIEFLIKFKKPLLSEHLEPPYIFNFKKCKFNEITQFLSNIDFDLNLDVNLSLDDIIIKFHEIIYHSFDLFVPKTKIYNNYSIVWSNAELRNLIIEKKAAHKKYKLFPFLDNYFKFSELRKKVKLLNLNCHNRYIANIENSISLNIKPFWKYVNSLKKSKNNVPDCMKYNSKISKNLSEMVNLFADYFSSVYVNSTINSNNNFS